MQAYTYPLSFQATFTSSLEDGEAKKALWRWKRLWRLFFTVVLVQVCRLYTAALFDRKMETEWAFAAFKEMKNFYNFFLNKAAAVGKRFDVCTQFFCSCSSLMKKMFIVTVLLIWAEVIMISESKNIYQL